MTNSWFQASRGPETVPLHDKGEKAKDAVPARPAWPEDAFVHVKAQLTGGDLEKIQRLQMTPTVTGDETGISIGADVGILYAPLAYCAVMIEKFEGDVFRDPDRDGMDMPRDLEQRVAVVRRLPLHVLTFTQAEILRKLADPFETSEPESASDDASEPVSIRRTATSKSTK